MKSKKNKNKIIFQNNKKKNNQITFDFDWGFFHYNQ